MYHYSDVKKNAYYDSVTLMLYSSELLEQKGIVEAAMMMGTDHNKRLMINSGVLKPEAAAAISPNDCVIGVLAQTQEDLDHACAVAANLLENKQDGREYEQAAPKTVQSAMEQLPAANVCVISVPGRFAAAETRKALDAGLHVLLFSDNVPLEKEINLKKYAVERGLLLMGPDCGTAIIHGAALGFANVVHSGDIGIVAAAGTGLQETTVLIDRLGGGVSEAIGTGGRDVKDAVGGLTMLSALDALANDPQTRVIGVVAKPPEQQVYSKIAEKVSGLQKPVVLCFLGETGDLDVPGVQQARTIEEAAAMMVCVSRGVEYQTREFDASAEEIESMAAGKAEALSKGRRYVRGLYSGGTLCYESMLLIEKAIGPVYSNIALNPSQRLKEIEISQENTLVDMGDDYFTDGMPHPMIDVRLRAQRIKKEAADPQTAVVLLDCVLGFGCHDNPAGALVEAIEAARAACPDGGPVFVASVCGTDADKQGRSKQEEILRKAGVVVFPSNAQAARFSAKIVARRN